MDLGESPRGGGPQPLTSLSPASYDNYVNEYIRSSASLRRKNSGAGIVGRRNKAPLSAKSSEASTPPKSAFAARRPSDASPSSIGSETRTPRRRKVVTFDELPELCSYEAPAFDTDDADTEEQQPATQRQLPEIPVNRAVPATMSDQDYLSAVEAVSEPGPKSPDRRPPRSSPDRLAHMKQAFVSREDIRAQMMSRSRDEDHIQAEQSENQSPSRYAHHSPAHETHESPRAQDSFEHGPRESPAAQGTPTRRSVRQEIFAAEPIVYSSPHEAGSPVARRREREEMPPAQEQLDNVSAGESDASSTYSQSPIAERVTLAEPGKTDPQGSHEAIQDVNHAEHEVQLMRIPQGPLPRRKEHDPIVPPLSPLRLRKASSGGVSPHVKPTQTQPTTHDSLEPSFESVSRDLEEQLAAFDKPVDTLTLQSSKPGVATKKSSIGALPLLGDDLLRDSSSGSLAEEFDRMFEKKRGYTIKQNEYVRATSTSASPMQEHRRNVSSSSAQSWSISPRKEGPAVPWQQTSPQRGTHASSVDTSARSASPEKGKDAALPPVPTPEGSPSKTRGMLPRRPISASATSPLRNPATSPSASRNFSKPIKRDDSSLAGQLQASLQQDDALLEGGGPMRPGRLFVRVVCLQRLQPPMKPGMQFSMVLDNGKHRVKTPWSVLRQETRIDQEFELIATDKLEFTLTMYTKYQAQAFEPESPKKGLAKLLASPKRKSISDDMFHDLHNSVGTDGSFGRSYHKLQDVKDRARLKLYAEAVPVWNEWVQEPVMSKGKQVSMRRRPAYEVASVRMQYLYLPALPASLDAEAPMSIAAVLHDLEGQQRIDDWYREIRIEGYLSQQGGDCSAWRRRFFKLEGTNLVAYHEATRAKRYALDLKHATALQYDETRDWSSGHGQLHENMDTDGGMLVPGGFRLRFDDGLEVGFYAYDQSDFERWTHMLGRVVGKVPTVARWTLCV